MIALWIFSFYAVPAVFFGTRAVVKTLRVMRRTPLAVESQGLSKRETRLIVIVSLAAGLLFVMLRYSLLWPWDVLRPKRTATPFHRAAFVVSESGPEAEQRQCLYCIQEGDDLEQILLATGCTIEEIAALNGGVVDWTPETTVRLPYAMCVYVARGRIH